MLRWGRLTCFGVVATLVALATPAFALDFSSHGYLRTRYNWLNNLDLQNESALGNDRFGLIQFNQLRLRIEPTLKVNDHLSLHTQFDILDNITFGSSQTKQLEINDPVVGTITLPPGAGSISFVGGQAGENASINVRRVWMDILSPIGKFRLGRQPAHWGLGIFQNDGNGPDDDFGDTVDGVTYLAQKTFASGGALTAGAFWDIAYEAQRDPRIGGLGDAIRDNGQDTQQWGLILLYEKPKFDLGLLGAFRKRDGGNGTTTTAFDINGVEQPAGIDGDTRVFIGDFYGKYRGKNFSIGAEYVYIGGKVTTGVAIDAIPFSGLAAPGIIQLPAEQDIGVHMAALEADAWFDYGGEVNMQAGFAQGDGAPLSQNINQFGFRPDYHTAFLMFRYPLGTSPQIRDGSTGELLTGGVPITGNFVNNAIYVGLTYKHKLGTRSIPQANEMKVGARAFTAWAHKDPVNLDFAALLNDPSMPAIRSRGKWYGVEGDVFFEGTFFDNLKTMVEFGVLFPGSAFDINPTLVDPGGIVATIPADGANIALGGRITATLEF